MSSAEGNLDWKPLSEGSSKILVAGAELAALPNAEVIPLAVPRA